MPDYAAILSEQVRDGKMSPREYHIALGRHYDYPECCIKNFVNMMSMGMMPGLFMETVLGSKSDVGYVQCVICCN